MNDFINERHREEFENRSAIAPDVAALNFRSFDGENENDLDEAFTLLIEEPDHNNNGTLSGKSQNDLANALRSGGWIFEGYKGLCIKPNHPRKNKEGKDIKYESPRGTGSLQLLIPHVSWRIGRKIATKVNSVLEANYLERMDTNGNPSDEDCGFWDWYLSTDLPIVITEGCKKACSLLSAGYPAIALNGVWGYGTNVKDIYGNVEKDELGKNIKTIHPDLEPFLDGHEIILALDRESEPKKRRTVEAAKAAFICVTEDDDLTVTQLVWRSPKGIDDYIVKRKAKALDRIYENRQPIEVKTEEPKSERVTAGDTLLEIGKTATYFHTLDKVAYADIYVDQ